MKFDDLPPHVEHISQILPRVLGDIALRTVKRALVEGACRNIIPDKLVQHSLKNFKRLRGLNDS